MGKLAPAPFRYVIQRHTRFGFDHYDVMYETPGLERLRAFQCPEAPMPRILRRGVSCRELPPHRREYLTFEGEVSGGRGNVVIWDSGALFIERDDQRLVMLSPRSERGREHGLWVLHFMGGVDWFLLSPSSNAREAKSF